MLLIRSNLYIGDCGQVETSGNRRQRLCNVASFHPLCLFLLPGEVLFNLISGMAAVLVNLGMAYVSELLKTRKMYWLFLYDLPASALKKNASSNLSVTVFFHGKIPRNLPSESLVGLQLSGIRHISHCYTAITTVHLQNYFCFANLKSYTHQTIIPHPPVPSFLSSHHSTFCLFAFIPSPLDKWNRRILVICVWFTSFSIVSPR